MSWIVETLLLNREIIRSNLYSSPDLSTGSYAYTVDEYDEDEYEHSSFAMLSFDSDDYNNLLAVEAKISEMYSEGTILPFEISILNYVMSNKTYTELEKILGISRNTLSKYFRSICDRISFSLGGEFTDEGYLSYMQDKYKLTDEQVGKIRKHINSKYRHTIRRNIDE